MSTDRNTNRPLKPALASTRTARTPLAPRIAGNATATPTAARPTAPRLPSSRTPAVSPRLKQPDETSPKTTGGTLNATPRAYGRGSREGQGSPGQDESLNDPRARGTLGPKETISSRSSAVSGVSQGLNVMQRPGRPKSTVGENLSKSPPLVRSPGYSDLNSSAKESIESRFFHASDVQKHEPVPKKPEPKKIPTFFYADGKEDASSAPPPKAPSPVLSAVSEKRTSNPWMRPEATLHQPKSPPMLSPSLAAASSATPFFPAPATPQSQLRSPSPSRENIHLSYRKGASQIFGNRPSPSSIAHANPALAQPGPEPQRPSIAALHRKSTSLSSIESGNSQQARRRSATSAENAHANSPLTHEIKEATVPRLTSPAVDLPSIDTSLASPALVGSPQNALSPTKHASELAAEARRERKVLDLEISNSSLLAINSSLEREVRRQKAELKRFRRLSRAGRLSMPRNELPSRTSEGLSTLGEEDADNDDDDMSAAGLVDDPDDLSDSEDGSLLSGGESHSPGSQTNKEQDRLAKDEKRLRVDLAKHKELLVQSQAMNQSIKRCMYATEEMLREGKAALQYNVRVSDVKLGGRILSNNDDDEEEIEVDDNVTDDGMETAKGLIDVWRGIRTHVDGSEGSGDRDSGIEVDKPLSHVSARYSNVTSTSHDSGRPPGYSDQATRNDSTDPAGMDADLDLSHGAS
ncbi:hypothetical protein PRZ48_001336 [Zasmidium cellare]|uniref:Uncharacterized protein n=1 Tax=Zasmidium cellare TaxID=395010 RepID=A0ABR0F102_ZASCE|nr:hypothetical protein PRZ48_001336 [Zasmidium cellare]